MSWKIDQTLSWPEHYVEYGFAVIKKAARPEFIDSALAEVKRLLGTDLPPQQWSSETVSGLRGSSLHLPYDGHNMTALPRVYDEPGVRAVIDTMFGSPQRWNGERMFQLFVSTYNPDATPGLNPVGHIDFVESPVPILGSGFMFQLSLIDSEPNSGNITIYPGTHKRIQKALIENPDLQYPDGLQPLLWAEPFEFVAEAGDMMIFHHLVGHESSASHAAHRTPRIVIHGQGLRDEWLREVDDRKPGLSPWERSLATNGFYHDHRNEEQLMHAYYQDHKGVM